jgi:anaerobic selenocysteine-containing dehydrogenase
MNKKDMENAGLQQKQIVDIYNYHNGVKRVAHQFIVIEFNIPEQCVATYFPETNVLVPINSTADKSNTPTSKSVVVEIKKVK